MFLFKNLRSTLDVITLIKAHYALAQTVLCCCITVWGGTGKNRLLSLERAQRGVLKVLSFRPTRYPTFDLYNALKLLTVRKFYLLNVILRKHSELPCKTNPNKRRKDRVCTIEYCRVEIARRNYHYFASSL